MAGEKTLIYKEDLLNTVLDHFGIDLAYLGRDLQFCQEAIELAPTVDAVEVVRIEEVKREMLQTLDTLIATHRDISNSQFSNYEKYLDIPKSGNDYYGIYADTMEVARRLVNAALTDLCSYGERKDNA